MQKVLNLKEDAAKECPDEMIEKENGRVCHTESAREGTKEDKGNFG